MKTPKALIHMSLMLLTNLCQDNLMQDQFIDYKNEKLTGFYFKIFLNAYMNAQSSTCFHFFGHIMTNISTTKKGR